MAGVSNTNDAADLDVEDGEPSGPWMMYARSLHTQGSEEDVRAIFSKFGPIKDLLIKLEHCTGVLSSFVWLEFTSFKQVHAAYWAYMLAKIPGHEQLYLWKGTTQDAQRLFNYSYMKTILNTI